MTGLLVLCVLANDPASIHSPDTLKKYIAKLYDAVRAIPADARIKEINQTNGFVNYNITWGKCYLDYNLGEDQDGLAFYNGEFLLGLTLNTENMVMDITSSEHTGQYQFVAAFGEVKAKGHKIKSRSDFWSWLNPPTSTGGE